MIGGLGGGLAGLGQISQGADAGSYAAAQALLAQLAARQAQQQQAAIAAFPNILAAYAQQQPPPIGLPPQAPAQPISAQPLPPPAGGPMMPPPYFPGGMPSGDPGASMGPGGAPGPQPIATRGSWYGTDPAHGWVDPNTPAGNLQAGGQRVSAGPGIALPSRAGLGQPFSVTAPNGRTAVLPQTDVGPAARTGRGVDINPQGAEALGYTPQTFPTDGRFRIAQASISNNAADLRQMGVPPQAVSAAQGVATNAAQMIDPSEYGRAEIKRVSDAIEQGAPDLPPPIKGTALMMLMKILAPEEQMAMRMYVQQNRDALALELENMTIRDADYRALLAQNRPETPFQQQEIGIRQQELGLKRQELGLRERALSDKESGGGVEKYATSKTLQVLDKDGNVLRTVLAREGRDKPGWIDSETGKPIDLKEGEHLNEITPSTGGGGRAGAQVLRQLVGGREVLSDLQNATSLPIGTTIGPLGTVQTGTSVMGALRGDLVRKITDQDSQLMQASMASLNRELSILMSPVYGGNWAAQQIDPLIPKTGDSIGTVVFKLARLRQSADNALEAVSKSPILSNDEKKFAGDLRGQLQTAVPWSTSQALSFAREGKRGQSFGDFLKVGATKTDSADPSMGPSGQVMPMPQEAIAELRKDPSPNRRLQFDEVFGPGASEKVLGNAGQ